MIITLHSSGLNVLFYEVVFFVVVIPMCPSVRVGNKRYVSLRISAVFVFIYIHNILIVILMGTMDHPYNYSKPTFLFIYHYVSILRSCLNVTIPQHNCISGTTIHSNRCGDI